MVSEERNILFPGLLDEEEPANSMCQDISPFSQHPHGHPPILPKTLSGQFPSRSQIDDHLWNLCPCYAFSNSHLLPAPRFSHHAQSLSLVYHLLCPHSLLWNFPTCLTETWLSTEQAILLPYKFP